MRELCKAMEESDLPPTEGVHRLFDQFEEPEKKKAADGLIYNRYIEQDTFGRRLPLRLTSKGVEYCNKLKKML